MHVRRILVWCVKGDIAAQERRQSQARAGRRQQPVHPRIGEAVESETQAIVRRRDYRRALAEAALDRAAALYAEEAEEDPVAGSHHSLGRDIPGKPDPRQPVRSGGLIELSGRTSHSGKQQTANHVEFVSRDFRQRSLGVVSFDLRLDGIGRGEIEAADRSIVAFGCGAFMFPAQPDGHSQLACELPIILDVPGLVQILRSEICVAVDIATSGNTEQEAGHALAQGG